MSFDVETSPVFPLLNGMQSAVFALAPERQKELLDFITRLGITVELDQEEERFCFHVDADNAVITVGLATAERLWAFCYAYTVLVAVVQHSDQGVEIDLTSNPKHWAAMCLLNWAVQCEVHGVHEPWPHNLVRPHPDSLQGSDDYAANELFLCMLGWNLLHEMAHVILGQEPSPDPAAQIQMEYAADDWGSAWILEKWQNYSNDERVKVKRTLGVTFYLTMSAALEAHRFTGGGGTHPEPAARLLRFLDAHVPESDGRKATKSDLAWLSAVAIMQLHLMAAKIAGSPQAEYADFRSFLVDAASRIAASNAQN